MRTSVRRTAAPGRAVECSFYLHPEARCDTRFPALDLPLVQVGVAFVSSKEAHRVFILDILGTIHDVDHLALGANRVTGTDVLDNLLQLARLRVPIAPDFNSNLVV